MEAKKRAPQHGSQSDLPTAQPLSKRRSSASISEQGQGMAASQQGWVTPETYRQALNLTQVGVWEWDLHSEQMTWDAIAARLFGLGDDPTQRHDRDWQQHLHPRDRDQVLQVFQQALATQTPYEVEFRVIHAGGKLHWLLVRGSGIYQDGQPVRMMGIVMDVSPRKRQEVAGQLAESAWQENQQLLDAVMINIPGGVFRCLYQPDGSVRFAYASESYRALLGLSLDVAHPFQPQWVFDCLHPEDRQSWQQLIQESQQTLAPGYLEYRITLPDGEEKWFARRVRFGWNAHGEFVVDGIDIDITDRKQMEQALQTAEAQLRRLTDNVPGVIYRYVVFPDGTGRLTYISPRCQEILGRSAADLIREATSLWNFVHPDDRAVVYQSLATAAQTGAPWQCEFRVLTDRHEVKWIRTSAEAEHQANGEVLWDGLAEDITTRHQAETQLHTILQGTAAATGEAFFPVLVQNLASVLDVRHAYVAELTDHHLRTIAFWSDQKICPNFTFEPDKLGCCQFTLAQGHYYCAEHLQQQFPELDRLQWLGAECYLGIAMQDAAGQPMGTLCILDDQPLKNQALAEVILRIFAARAAAELERQRATIALQQLNQDLEVRVEQRTQELKDSLQEKEVLLQEVHHRVKNNLQMIQSLLNLQRRSIQDPQVLTVLTDSQNRINAMALVHEKLYQTDRLSQINFKNYVRSLMRDLLKSYGLNLETTTFSIQVADLELALDMAIACGLIINELFSNAIKYAFPQGQRGTILIQFTAHGADEYELVVADNGVGIPAEIDLSTSKSLGLRLVHALTRQLRGTLRLEREDGTRFTITFAQPTEL
ncbi:MAG: PAS domain-containing protein [Elainella sp. Prado103]|jgi:PAS domain S-box-containing protein|nr:PAS domain-containing protein [Elainella sp. Prado103]